MLLQSRTLRAAPKPMLLRELSPLCNLEERIREAGPVACRHLPATFFFQGRTRFPRRVNATVPSLDF